MWCEQQWTQFISETQHCNGDEGKSKWLQKKHTKFTLTDNDSIRFLFSIINPVKDKQLLFAGSVEVQIERRFL